jgi:hypothetical protein
MTKTTMKKRLATIFLAVNTLMLIQHTTKAQVSLTSMGTAYTTNFDTYDGVSTATLPAGWTAVCAQFRGRGNGSSNGVPTNALPNSGGSWSFGATGGSDWSLGYIGSGSATSINYGVTFVNNTGSVINSLDISYNFENWRFAGGNNVGFTVSSSGALAGSSGVINTNLSQTSAASPATVPKSYTVTGLSIAVGATFGLSWTSSDGAGTDNGKSIDDFSITPRSNGPSLSIADITHAEGNAGTTSYDFVVTLSSAAPAGGVTFDIATANGTATLADNDYVANTLTSQTIPAGSTTYTFTVLVNGDMNVEPNETFLVNVSNVTGTGVTVTDGQAIGTITNEDYIAPVITGNPAAAAYCSGALVTYTASATGNPTPTVQWQVSTNGGATYANAGGTSATTTTYTFIATPGVNNNMYQAVFTNPGGSAITTAVTLTVNPTYSVPQSASVCSGGSYTFPDGSVQTNITTTANHTSHLMSVSGCDSAIVTTVTVKPVYNFSESFSICSGTDYTFPDGSMMTGITTATSHTSNLTSVYGCDSVIVTTINVNPSYNVIDTVWVCSGSDYTFGDGTTETNITTTVTNTSFLFTVQFCDSIVNTVVMVNPVYNLTETVAVCSGSDYTFPDGTTQANITTATTYTSNLTTINGCDSSIVTTVNVNPVYNLSETVSVCSGSDHMFPDSTMQTNITTATTYTSNLTSVYGCDSIIVTTVNVNPVYNFTETVTICSGTDYTFPDGTMQSSITATTVYTSNLVSVYGCDSIIVTTVNVNPGYSIPQSVAICSGSDYTFPDGTTQTNITTTAMHTSSFLTINGCDSSIVTTVSINPVYNLSQAASVCTGSSYTFPDGTTQTSITSATTYTSNFTTMNGCDSVIVTTVNVNPTDTMSMSQNICMGDSISFFGTFLSTAGTYYHTLTSMAGCDSVVEFSLGLNPLPMVSFNYMGGSVTSICAEMEDTLYLDGGMPAGGVYSSPFSSGDTLFPQELVNAMGGGNYIFGYIYTDGSNGCSALAIDTLAISYCVGMKENAVQSLNVSVYPNPAHDQLIVEFEQAADGTSITLLNTLGQIVLTRQTDARSMSLDLLDIKAGIYYLSVESRSAKVTKKIIVE